MNIDIKKGDILLGGRFRNKKIKVRSMGTDSMGQPTVNGKQVLKVRIAKLIKKEVESILKEGPAGTKKLRIFDFDDTLAKVKTTIKVKNTISQKVTTLTPAQFAVYNGLPGDMFDFSDFNKTIRDATPIQHNLKLLSTAAGDSTTKTTILTARMLAYPVKRYLKKELNLDVYVIALGSANPELKRDYIEKEIKKGYNDIVFIDDSEKNVAAVSELISKYPDIKLKIIHER